MLYIICEWDYKSHTLTEHSYFIAPYVNAKKKGERKPFSKAIKLKLWIFGFSISNFVILFVALFLY